MSGEAPTWEHLRANGWMVVDHTSLRFAVYPTASGMTALKFQLASAEAPQVLSVCPDEIPLLCKQLECAQGIAERQREANAEAVSVQFTHDLLNRLKEGAR